MTSLDDPVTAFIEAAVWHGTLERAEAILAAYPDLANSSIHAAAILGDDDAVRRHLGLDAGNAMLKAGPYGGDALVYLCLSKYLRLDKARSESFVRAATALLDAGADPNTGFQSTGEYPDWETALYGAAAYAHHPEVTRLLLERGANPNDIETVYHSPESYDSTTMKLLVETGRVTPENLAMMLVRKHDWHDYDGIRYLLAHGADPNHQIKLGFRALHHAIRRDNRLNIIELLLAHGADPTLPEQGGRTAVVLAARRGRSDVLAAFAQRGFPIRLQGVEQLIAACAMNDAPGIQAMVEREPRLVDELISQGGTLLAEFAGTANKEGIAHLLDLGVNVAALYPGDGYFDIAKDSTALHVAAWKAWPAVVKLLIERGAPVNALDGKGRMPLALAVRACVDSYWTNRRSPESVEALLRAGARVSGIDFPSGYAEVDDLLRQYSKLTH
jgi:ankyrin repeat protein